MEDKKLRLKIGAAFYLLTFDKIILCVDVARTYYLLPTYEVKLLNH